jgi:hypothetical protein
MADKFTLRMAGHELLGEEAAEKIIANQGAHWLVFVLMAYIESNNIQTETAALLREWHDRRMETADT